MIINHPVAGELDLEDIKADVQASKKNYNYEFEYSFTAATVQALINKIEEQEAILLSIASQD